MKPELSNILVSLIRTLLLPDFLRMLQFTEALASRNSRAFKKRKKKKRVQVHLFIGRFAVIIWKCKSQSLSKRGRNLFFFFLHLYFNLDYNKDNCNKEKSAAWCYREKFTRY